MINGEEESGTVSSSMFPPDTELFKYMLENAEIDYERTTDSPDTQSFELENGLKVLFDNSGTLISFELP